MVKISVESTVFGSDFINFSITDKIQSKDRYSGCRLCAPLDVGVG